MNAPERTLYRAAVPAEFSQCFEAQRAAYLADPEPSYAQRRKDLDALARLIKDNRERLVEAICRDYGNRSEFETLFAEYFVVLETIHDSPCNAAACHAQMYTMGTVLRHGSDEQKKKYLPKIASGELRLQAFGVTEPTTGSDTTKLKTTFELMIRGEFYFIAGMNLLLSIKFGKVGDMDLLGVDALKFNSLGIETANIGLPGAGPHVVADVERLAREIVQGKMKLRANCAAPKAGTVDSQPKVRQAASALSSPTAVGSSTIAIRSFVTSALVEWAPSTRSNVSPTESTSR